MAAPEGNQFWLLRSKHGRDKIFSTPDVLWDGICGYFNVCLDNPWFKVEAMKSGSEPGKLVYIPTVRPFTISGLCNYLDISHQTWEDYKKREGFIEVITRAENIIYTQKFEGAAVGAFNAVIIARDLGLRDKQDVDVRTPEGVTVLYKQQEGNQPLPDAD